MKEDGILTTSDRRPTMNVFVLLNWNTLCEGTRSFELAADLVAEGRT